jgi:hypothetical protein
MHLSCRNRVRPSISNANSGCRRFSFRKRCGRRGPSTCHAIDEPAFWREWPRRLRKTRSRMPEPVNRFCLIVNSFPAPGSPDSSLADDSQRRAIDKLAAAHFTTCRPGSGSSRPETPAQIATWKLQTKGTSPTFRVLAIACGFVF